MKSTNRRKKNKKKLLTMKLIIVLNTPFDYIQKLGNAV